MGLRFVINQIDHWSILSISQKESGINTKQEQIWIEFKNYPFLFGAHLRVCVFIYVHQYGWCVQIIRWWCSNLVQVPLQNLGSVANYTFYFSPPVPPISTVFLDILIFLLYPTSPPISIKRRRCPSFLHPLPIPSPGSKRRPPGLHPHLPPASLFCSTLRPGPRACVSWYLPRSFDPPLPPSAWN